MACSPSRCCDFGFIAFSGQKSLSVLSVLCAVRVCVRTDSMPNRDTRRRRQPTRIHGVLDWHPVLGPLQWMDPRIDQQKNSPRACMAASPDERPDDARDSRADRALSTNRSGWAEGSEGLSRGDRQSRLARARDEWLSGSTVHPPEEGFHREGSILPGLRLEQPPGSLATAHDEESDSLGCYRCREEAAAQGRPEIQAQAEEGEIAYLPSFLPIAARIVLAVVLGVIVIGWLYWKEFE